MDYKVPVIIPNFMFHQSIGWAEIASSKKGQNRACLWLMVIMCAILIEGQYAERGFSINQNFQVRQVFCLTFISKDSL